MKIKKTMSKNNWSEDKLERKEIASFLTNYLTKRYSITSQRDKPDSLVMSFRADWGFGKTFFLNRWAKDLKDLDYPVVWFDAWFNDFSENPLIGFISAIEKDLTDHFRKIPKAQKMLEEATFIAKKLIKPAGFLLSAIAAKQLTGYGMKDLKETLDGIGIDGSTVDNLITEYGVALLKEHKEKQELIISFKEKLKNLVDQLSKEQNIQLPIIIIVDELDRCKPTYAIELLESIKHLFGVGGVYFVIATNTEQLGHSICSVYGEKFDSEKYLKRFFEQEYLLPPPDTLKFSNYMFERPILSEIKQMKIRTVSHADFHKNHPLPAVELTKLSSAFGLSIRDIEQVCLTLEATLLNWPENETIQYTYLLLLIITKHVSSSTFQKIYSQTLTDQGLQEFTTNHLKADSTLSIYKQQDSFSSKPAKLDIPNVFLNYYKASRMTSKDFYDRSNSSNNTNLIYDLLSYDSPRHWSGDPPPLKIASYPKRVAEAGQLFVS